MVSSTLQKIIWGSIIVFNISKVEIVKEDNMGYIQDGKVRENVQ